VLWANSSFVSLKNCRMINNCFANCCKLYQDDKTTRRQERSLLKSVRFQFAWVVLDRLVGIELVCFNSRTCLCWYCCTSTISSCDCVAFGLMFLFIFVCTCFCCCCCCCCCCSSSSSSFCCFCVVLLLLLL